MTTRRVNITLPSTLHDQAVEYCMTRGLSLSGLITDLLRGTITEEPGKMDDMIRKAIIEYLHSPRGEELLREVLHEQDDTPPEEDVLPMQNEVPGRSVLVTPDLITRVERWKNRDIQDITGLPHGVLSKIRNGKQKRLFSKTYEALIRGLEDLEKNKEEQTRCVIQ